MPSIGFYKDISKLLPVFFVVYLGLILHVQCYSRGAPEAVCNGMIPQHGVGAQTTKPPYEIRISSNTYFPNQQITVTIEGKSGEVFKGFMLAARVKGKPDNYGRFIPTAESRTRNCWNKIDSAITHSDGSEKPNLKFIWVAPATDVGDLQITGTILESGKVFWINVTSEVMTFRGNGVTSALTSTHSPESPLVNELRCPAPNNCLLQWKMDKAAGATHFTFGLETSESKPNMYISMALSDDDKMGHDSVMECLHYPNGSILAQLSYNPAKSNELVPSEAIKLTSAKFENGWMECSFTRENTVNNPKIFNLAGNAWYLLVAIGEVDLNKPRQKAIHSIHFNSATKIDLTKNEGPVESTNSSLMFRIHGSLLIFAWVFFASVGMFAARYSRTINIKMGGVALWFKIHSMSMMSTVLLTLVAFIIIFVAKDGIYSTWKGGLPADAHPILGIIVMVLVIMNPIGAFKRPPLGVPMRIRFNRGHRVIGVVTAVLADSAMFIGILMFDHTNQTSSITVMSIFLIYKVLAVLTMEILECCKKRTVEPVELKAPGEKATEEQEDEYFGFIKKILLIAHIIISFILSVILVILLNIKD